MAGAGRRTFQPGEVLTASNVMNYLQDQAVMNFAGTAARGSAIGTAVSEGMVSYLADTNVVQAYDGSAWNSLAYSSSVITPGLVPIIPSSVSVNAGSGSFNSTTGEITFTGATTLTINGIFSSTYSNYKIIWEVASTTGAGADVYVQLSNSGGTLGANYVTSYVSVNSSSVVSGTYGTQGFFNAGRVNGANGAYIQMDILNPGTTRQKRFVSLSQDPIISRTNYAHNTTATAYTNILIYPNGQSITDGKCKVYGYN